MLVLRAAKVLPKIRGILSAKMHVFHVFEVAISQNSLEKCRIRAQKASIWLEIEADFVVLCKDAKERQTATEAIEAPRSCIFSDCSRPLW